MKNPITTIVGNTDPSQRFQARYKIKRNAGTNMVILGYSENPRTIPPEWKRNKGDSDIRIDIYNIKPYITITETGAKNRNC